MARNHPVWFPWFPSDALGSARIAAMLPEQEGAYRRLLDYCWIEPTCCLAADDASLAMMTKLGPRWKKLKGAVLACFKPCPEHPERLTNAKLWDLRLEQIQYAEHQSQNGARGAKKRWGKHSDPDGDPNDGGNGESMGSPSRRQPSGNATALANDSSPSPNPRSVTTGRSQKHRVQAIRNATPSGTANTPDQDFPEPDVLSIRQQQLVVELQDLTGERGDHEGLYRRIVGRLGDSAWHVYRELKAEIDGGTTIANRGAYLVEIAKKYALRERVALFDYDAPGAAHG